VVEASLLILDVEPQGTADSVENSAEDFQPAGYRAVKAGILAGLDNKSLKGGLRRPESQDFHGNWTIDETRYDVHTSFVEVESLIAWLRSRGFSTGYFFSDAPKHHGLKDPAHPRYAPKLAAAVEAWESYVGGTTSAGTAKQQLAKWLRLHAAEYGLSDEDGKLRETVIEQLATIANWATRGGAPKAEPPNSPEPFDQDLDDEIPF